MYLNWRMSIKVFKNIFIYSKNFITNFIIHYKILFLLSEYILVWSVKYSYLNESVIFISFPKIFQTKKIF